MATDADIPVPVCEAQRGEQVGTFVDNIIKITVSQLSLENQTQYDKHNELPTAEGENFSKLPSVVEVRCEANNDSHDVSEANNDSHEELDQTAKEGLDTLLLSTKLSDQPVELAAKGETCMEESQQNSEDGDRGVVPEQCSTDSSAVTPETDAATGVAQLSKDTSSDHHGTNDSFNENIAFTKEILQENSLLIEEGEELNVELKTTDDKSADEKPTEEDTLSNVTDKVTSEQQALDNERNVEDNFNTAAEKASHENSTSGESIITLETSNSNELQSTSDLNASRFEEEETTIQKGVVTDHSGPELAEKSEESSPVQVEDSQIEHDERVEEESERLPLTESKVGSNDNGLPEEQSMSVTLHGDTIEAEEATTDADDGQKESLESFQPIVSSSHEEGSINEVLQETTSDHTNGKIIDEDLSSEAHYDVSESTENKDQTIKDGTDTLLLSPKLAEQPEEFAANEETSTEQIQQNVEESDSTDKDVLPEQCSKDSSFVVTTEIDDAQVDNARVVASLSNDTSSYHHGSNDSSTENVALTEEILQETDLPSEETESHAPCISEGEELNVQVKTTDDKYADQKPTEEDMSCNLTNETSEQEGLENERSVEDNFNTAAEEESHEKSTSGETITALETSNNDELQSKSDLNSSLSKEEETNVHEGERSVTTSEDYEVPLENTSSESHGDVGCQSKTLEHAATDHSNPNLAEKSEESSIIPVEDSQIECDEHLEEESERLQVTEVSAGGTIDNVPATTDNVKDEDEVHEEAELSEIEQSTRCTSAKEDMQIENPAESLHVASENVEVPHLSQENSIEGPPKEQSRDVTLHKNTIEAEEATTNADDRQKESLESFPPIASSSHEEGSLNEVLQEATSDHTNEKKIDEDDKHKEVLENLSSDETHCEVNNTSRDVSKGAENTDQTMKDGTNSLLLGPNFVDQPIESEKIQQNAEEFNSTEKDVVPEQCSKDSEIDDPEMDDAKAVTQLSNDTSSDQHGSGAEEILQETDLSSKETESHAPCISEGEKLNVQLKTTDNKSADEKPAEEDMSHNLTNEVSKEVESDQNEMTSENERSVEEKFNTVAEEATHEKSTSGETTTAQETSNNDELQSKSDLNSSLSKEEETNVHEGERSVTTSKDYGVPSENTLSESHGDVEYQSKTLEDAPTNHRDPNLAEKSEESSIVKVEDSQIECDEHLEEESERLPQTEVSTGDTNDNVPTTTDNVKDEDEVHKEAELSEIEQSTLVKEDVEIENPAESSQVENIEVSKLSQENNIKVLPEEKSTNATLHENTIDEADTQKDDRESFPPIVSGSLEEGNMNAVLQEVTSDHTDEKIIDEVDKHEEVIENLSTTVSTEDAEGNSLSKLDRSENIREDESVKECEPLPQDLAREVSDVSTFLHEARSEDGEPKTVELCENERGIENTEAEHVNSEDTKALDLLDKISEGGTVDATEEKEETPENVITIVPNEKMEENSLIHVDDQKTENEEHLDKENEQVSNNDEGIVKDGGKIEDENPSGTELFVNDRNTESVSLTEEAESENPVESLHEDVQTSDFGQHAEETGILEEQIPSEKSQGIPSDETDGTTNDAANTNEKTKELQNVSNEDNDKDLPIEVDASEMKHDTNLEEEPERPSLIEASKEECQSKVESTSSVDIETTCSLEVQNLAENSQTIISDKTTDAADEKEPTLENVAMETTHEQIKEEETDATESKNIDELKNRGEDSIKPELENEETTESTSMKEETDAEKPIDSLQIKPEDIKQRDSSPDINHSIEEQIPNTDSPKISIDNAEREPVDASHTNEESVEIKDVAKDSADCEKEDSIQIEEVGSQNPLNEALAGNDNDDESTKITESCLIKEEESLESLQVEARDIETPPLSQDRETISPYEEIPAEKSNDDEPTTAHEARFINENAVKAILCEDEGKEGSALVKEEVRIESLQVADEDTNDTSSGQDREASHLEEQAPTTDSCGTMGDQKDAKTLNLTDLKEETLEDKNYATTPSDDTKEGTLLEQKENPEKDSESTSLEEAPKDDITESALVREVAQAEDPMESSQVETEENVEIKDVAKDTADCEKEDSIQIEEVGSQNPVNEALAGNDNNDESTKITESCLIKEEESLESLQVEARDTETPPSSRDRETSSPYEQSPIANTEGIMDDNKEEIEENLQVQEDCSQLEENKGMENESENIPSTEAPAVPSTEEEKVETPVDEQIPTADPLETCYETQEKPVDAASVNNDVVRSVPNGDNEDNSLLEVDGLQEPSSEEIPAEKSNDDEPTTAHEAKFINENAVKANLCEDEEREESALSLQVADEDTNDTSSGQDREASHLEEQAPTTDSCGTMVDQKDAKTLDLTDLKEETHEDKNYATTPSDDTKENTLLEQKENPEKDSESTSLADFSRDDITESTLVREVAQAEDPIESSQVETEDIQDTAKGVPREDDSPNEQNTEATLIKEDVSIDDNEENKAIDPTVFQNETPKDEVIEEMESFDVKAATKEEEGYLEGVQMTSETPEESFDGSAAVPTSETLEETDARRCTETEVQVSNGEKEAKITEQVAENDQTDIKETLPSYASENVSESRELNGEEISRSPISEASEETREEVEIEDQEQESTLQVSELIQDSSAEKIEKDAYSSLVSANDSGITEEMQKLKDVPLPAPEEKIIETTNRKESDAVEGATNDECIDHQEHDDTTRSFSYDKKPTEKEQETVANVILPASVDHSPTETELTNREEPCTGITATGDDEEKSDKGNEDEKEACEASVEGILVDKSSVTDLETKNDGEALEIKEATPSLAEGQDVESASVEGTSNFPGSSTEEKSDSNEVAITPGENKSGYESNNQTLESVQSCDIISKTEEENLKAEAKIQFDKAVAEDILQEETTSGKEIMKDDISSEKEQFSRINKEDEVITDSHQEDEVNQDQQINSKEKDEYTKNGNETETVAEVSKETDDKAPEDLEEKIVTNEATEIIIQQEEQVTSIEEHTTEIDNEKAHELDVACVKTDTQDTNKEGVQIEIIPGKETEEQNKKDEICSSDEVQAKDEEKLMLSEGKNEKEANETYKEAFVETEKLDFASQTKDTSESEVPSASEDIALTERSSEDTIATAEVEGIPEEKIETSEEQETKPIQNAPVSETLGQEIQGQQRILSEKETVPESSIRQSSVEDTAQLDKREENQQIDSSLFLPQAQCPDIKTSEKDLPAHVEGLGSFDVAELDASPRSLKDKHVVQEADDARNMNPESLDGDKNISTELSQVEHVIVEPSKVEHEKEECINEETEKPSLSDLLRVSNTTRETSQMADHSPTAKEPTRHTDDDVHAENTDEPEHENSKTDEEKDGEEESQEHEKSDLSSEAPVMVDMGDADVKVTPKKSHNILSGVGSKMKHSIAKVKKAITGKSSQTKTPSPKKASN